MKDLISVIVPVYNVEKYLNRCIESIVQQTYKNLEIILVDDGSPDNCPQICDEWAQKDPRIKVIHKKNGGLSDARNVGFQSACGKYICFVDSDDWIEVDFCEVLLSAIVEYDCDIAACGYRKTDVVKATRTDDGDMTVEILDSMQALQELIHERKIQQVVWNKMYKRAIIHTLFEVGKYHEDEFWTYQIIDQCTNMVIINYIGYNYFQRPDSIMGQNFSAKRLDAIEAKLKRQDYMKKKHPELYNDALVNLYYEVIYLGQTALKASETNTEVFKYLKDAIQKYSLPERKIDNLKWKHWMWLKMARISLRGTCRIRNHIGIGW